MKIVGRTLGVLAALAWLAACGDPLITHAFEGQHYDAVRNCLEDKSVIDVVKGKAHGTCEGVRCYQAANGEVFVSTDCTGTADFRDGTDDPDGTPCALALAVHDLGKAGACPADA